MADKPVLNMEIPQELYDKAKEEAARLSISLASLIRIMVVNYFEKKDYNGRAS